MNVFSASSTDRKTSEGRELVERAHADRHGARLSATRAAGHGTEGADTCEVMGKGKKLGVGWMSLRRSR